MPDHLTTTRTAPTTLAQFRRRAERLIRTANPDAVAVGIVLDWQHSARVTWADDTKGFSGVVRVTSPGHRTREMIATFHDNAMWVR